MSEKKVYYNGKIITMSESKKFVEAVGIEGERIIAVGKLQIVKENMQDNCKYINLEGKTLLPGFIDCHIHPIGAIIVAIYPDLSEVKSIFELQSTIKDWIEENHPKGLVFGFSLNEENFDTPTLPTRWDLDEACLQDPVFVLRYDGHVGVANSKALELAGIDEKIEEPEGGIIHRDDTGKLTGILSENATNLIIAKATLPNIDVIRKTAKKVFYNLAKLGITSFHAIIEMDTEGGVENLGGVSIPMLKSLSSDILQNVYSIVYTRTPKKLRRLKKSPLHSEDKFSKFKVGAIKSWLDGTFGAYTAYMYEPFSDKPDKSGYLVIQEKDIYDRMQKAHDLGYQIAIHAIGDKANRLLVDMYKKITTISPRDDTRHRIEHASMLPSDIIEDMSTLGIVASCQPPFINSEYSWLESKIGKKRCRYTYPYKSLINAGVIVAAGSDYPVENPDPILGLHALVNRNGFVPEECISMEEALKFYTINGAYAAFEEDIKGSIDVGKLADFVILDKNPLEVSTEEINTIKVLETIIRGNTVYKSDSPF